MNSKDFTEEELREMLKFARMHLKTYVILKQHSDLSKDGGYNVELWQDIRSKLSSLLIGLEEKSGK